MLKKNVKKNNLHVKEEYIFKNYLHDIFLMIWVRNYNVSGPRFNPADPLASNLASDPGPNLQDGARLTSRITSSLSSLQRSSRNVIEKIRNVSSILDDKVEISMNDCV